MFTCMHFFMKCWFYYFIFKILQKKDNPDSRITYPGGCGKQLKFNLSNVVTGK